MERDPGQHSRGLALSPIIKVGEGALAALTITANFLMSLLIDRYGWFGMPVHGLTARPPTGAALMATRILFVGRG